MLDKYPRSSIDVFVLIVEAGGGEFAASICAASLALAHAGIDLFDMVSAASVAIILSEPSSSDEVIVDPDSSQIARSCLRATTAFMGSIQQVTHVDVTGSADLDQVELALEVCVDSASMVYRIMQNTLLDVVNQ
jgi:exosome complex component MTR3